MFQLLKKEFTHIASIHRGFFICAFLTAAFLCMDYAIIRPISTSVFLTTFRSSSLPYAWLMTIPVNLICVGFYNFLLIRVGCLKTFLVFVAIIMGGHGIAQWLLQTHPWISFVYYAWKEVYIMLMLHQLWSVVQTMFSFHNAQYSYGILFAAGGLGGMAGSLIPGLFAVRVGSEQLLILAIPVLLLATLCYAQMLKYTNQGMSYKLHNQERTHIGKAFMHGITLIRSSRILLFILVICVIMHISISLGEFQFGCAVEAAFADKNLRTQMLGRIFALVQIAALGLQLIGSFLFIRFLGFQRSHLLTPCLMGLHQFAVILFPTFGLYALFYGLLKVMHYSTFGILKELLYVPLGQEEKFRAKAFIDVFVDRSAKALGSLLILGCQFLLSAQAHIWISILGLTLFILWGFVVNRHFQSTIPSIHKPHSIETT